MPTSRSETEAGQQAMEFPSENAVYLPGAIPNGRPAPIQRVTSSSNMNLDQKIIAFGFYQLMFNERCSFSLNCSFTVALYGFARSQRSTGAQSARPTEVHQDDSGSLTVRFFAWRPFTGETLVKQLQRAHRHSVIMRNLSERRAGLSALGIDFWRQQSALWFD